MRWEHPERGLIAPEEFIYLAEETGLIVPIGERVLREACIQTRRWRDLYPDAQSLSIGVNLSARQLRQSGLAANIEMVLRECGLSPDRLTLELTESALVEDAEHNLGALRELQDLGVRFAIDDFGTGYSSLSYLRRLPAGMVKLDGSFVEGIGRHDEDEVLLSGVIGIAHGLGLSVCAEGIETARQAARLRKLGCDLAQGYYFSGPLVAEEASRYLRANA